MLLAATSESQNSFEGAQISGAEAQTRWLGHSLQNSPESGMMWHDVAWIVGMDCWTQAPTLQAPKRQGISGSAVLALNSQIAAQIHGYSWLERGVASLRPQTIPLSSSCLLEHHIDQEVQNDEPPAQDALMSLFALVLSKTQFRRGALNLIKLRKEWTLDTQLRSF